LGCQKNGNFNEKGKFSCAVIYLHILIITREFCIVVLGSPALSMEKATSSSASSDAPSCEKLLPESAKVPESEAFQNRKSFVKMQSLRPSNKVRSFIKSIFYREEVASLEVEKSVDPRLIQSIKDERMNYIWTLLVIASIVTYITYITYHWLLRWIGVIDSAVPLPIHSTAQMMMYFLFFSVISHRILGALSCILLRYWLRDYRWTNDGHFDIHCAWASWRGFLDKNEVVFHDVIWHNPSEFQNTPYLYYAKEITIGFEWVDIYNWFFSNANILVLREIVIDTVVMFVERCDDNIKVDHSLNLYAAMGIKDGAKGSENSENAKKVINFFSNTRANVFRAFGQNMSRMEKMTIYHDSEKSELNKPDEDQDQDADDVTNSPQANQQKQKQPPDGEWRLDLHRLLLLSIELHPSEMISNSAIDSSSNSVKIKSLFMRRKHLTGEPSRKKRDGQRKVLRWSRVLSKISDAIVSSVVSHNPRALPSLIAKMGYSKTVNVAKSVASLPMVGISTVSHTIGSFASQTTAAVFKSVGYLRRRRQSKSSDTDTTASGVVGDEVQSDTSDIDFADHHQQQPKLRNLSASSMDSFTAVVDHHANYEDSDVDDSDVDVR